MNKSAGDILHFKDYSTNRRDVSELTGLELMSQLCAGQLPISPICKALGFEMIDVQHGKVIFEGRPALTHYNPIGCVHGGWAAALLDSCMGYAVYTTLGANSDARTLEIKINYVRGILEGTGKLQAEGNVLHKGRSTATAEGRIVDKDGKLFAHGTTTCIII